MVLRVDFSDTSEKTYEELLEELMFYYSLPSWAYTKKELANFVVQKYKLKKLIEQEREYNNEIPEFSNTS